MLKIYALRELKPRPPGGKPTNKPPGGKSTNKSQYMGFECRSIINTIDLWTRGFHDPGDYIYKFYTSSQPQKERKQRRNQMTQPKASTENNYPEPEKTKSTTTVPEWITEITNGGTCRHVDLNTGTNGWASPPGNVFSLRSTNYFTTKQKSPGGDYLLSPAGVDWFKSTTKLDHILSRPDNRVAQSLKNAPSHSFIFAVNFQIPTKDPLSLVLYFTTQQPIPSDSILHKLINTDDDSFREERDSKSLAML